LFVKAGADIATLGLPNSAGEPKAVIENSLVVDFQVKNLFEAHSNDIAAMILQELSLNLLWATWDAYRRILIFSLEYVNYVTSIRACKLLTQ